MAKSVKPLTDEEILKKVVEIVSCRLPEVSVYIFGSRAKGTYKYNSDFDIALEGEEKIPPATLAQIREELDNLPTLKSFDLIDLKRTSTKFAEAVKRTGVILYDGRRVKDKA
ncbi:Nucleotidyltransferase domain-containing protein [Desulfurobacterium pacificum]|uniref:Nucleotidyltransferase domain-containing protein n=1 Tax=Desulfurobacterium pacificum TaxID=240166 RepID=A0ABY1NQF0_9BACT|nr:nucleotidyltransferase domain-containing protein [Desulfurobacterium pacificum]SMP15527.1 Nucleotidyltransferase domain-containing protein [Desulfurobacterium pacificum]